MKNPLMQASVIALLSLGAGLLHSRIAPVSLSLASPASSTTNPEPAQAHPTSAQAQTAASAPAPTQPPAQTQPTASAPAKDDRFFISLSQAKELIANGATVIDARNPPEYQQGRIQGALNLPPDVFAGGQVPEVLYALNRSAKTLIYCGGGDCDASKLVALRLREQGFSDLYIYHDGFTGWTKANEPIEK